METPTWSNQGCDLMNLIDRQFAELDIQNNQTIASDEGPAKPDDNILSRE
ncbi:hypothetical protein [Falsiruegeria litorea]|nr:hypothetical protein [Falsiruegeria litorea]